MAKPQHVKWADQPAEQDYPAAASYLRLIAGEKLADDLAGLLARAETVHHPVKDILRAARLPLLPPDDAQVVKDIEKVRAGIALSPVLLVQGDIAHDLPLQIADGYHRVCASYHIGENTPVPCRLVALP